jgi:hypothetical protein
MLVSKRNMPYLLWENNRWAGSTRKTSAQQIALQKSKTGANVGARIAIEFFDLLAGEI